MSVIVIGSLIIDNTIYVQKLPERGETTFAKSSLISYGGKGANQALAAHLVRVRNDRMRNELGVHLRYPTYREGLAAIVRVDNT